MTGPATSTLPHPELHRLLHGPCEPRFLDALRDALSDDHPSLPTGPGHREERITGRLQQLARALPPARQMLEAPEQLAALLAWSAVAEPALCMALITHHVLCLRSLHRLAPEHQALKAHFDALESGRVKGSYLITEAGQANSHLAPRTQAVFDPATREFVLSTPDWAAAKFAGVSTHGAPRTAAVLARLVVAGADRGVFTFLVELTDEAGLLPGVVMSTPLALDAIPLDYAQVRFENVRLPFAHWLSDSATLDADGTFHDPLGSPDARLARTLCVGQDLWGALPSVAAATSRQSAVLALRYARRRRTQSRLAPGMPLLAYRTQQYAVLGSFANAFALTCAADGARALWSATTGNGTGSADMTFTPWAAVSRPLSAYKAHTVRAAAEIAAVCQRHCGFSGHLDINKLAAYHGFHHAFDTAGGDSQLIYYDLGRALVDEADHTEALAPPPAAPSPSDPAWWPAVARRHEQRLAGQLRRRRDERARSDPDGFAVWNPLLGAAGELGEIHAAVLAADDVSRILASLHDAALTAVLEPLAALHGLLATRRWAGSLLAARTIRPEDLDRLSPQVDELCDRIMPHLPLLDDAFGYPQAVVSAPLAAPDFNDALAGSLGWQRGGTP
ncbi:acyl-CoA dehydrogenase [Streptomyces mauvecolor]|uniref:Acyl-CoA dehydrogenase n=1 Tax=Streptomyces mauvecolor TaxID=58345 RepID=A0ABV9UWB6_9ACTN